MDERITLFIDVFDLTGQEAHVLKTLSVYQLIREILVEFSGPDSSEPKRIPYLKPDSPQHYELFRGDRSLEYDQTISQYNLNEEEHLVLKERQPDQWPDEASPLIDRVYLREPQSGRVFRLYWQPAIIGRFDETKSDNDLLAVDAEDFIGGRHVSRRHAKIEKQGDIYYLTPLTPEASYNPVYLNGTEVKSGTSIAITQGDKIGLPCAEIVELELFIIQPTNTITGEEIL
jgi:hypothetical protein